MFEETSEHTVAEHFMLLFLSVWDGTEKKIRTASILLNNSMQHSPSWESNRFSASQEIPRIM